MRGFEAVSLANKDWVAEQYERWKDDPASVDERWGGERALADIVDVHQLKRGTGPQHERLAVVVGEEDFSVHGDR